MYYVFLRVCVCMHVSFFVWLSVHYVGYVSMYACMYFCMYGFPSIHLYLMLLCMYAWYVCTHACVCMCSGMLVGRYVDM